MGAILQALLPAALWVLGKIFAKVNADSEAKKSFLVFVADLEREQLASVRLNETDRAQLAELDRRRALLQEGQDSENT